MRKDSKIYIAGHRGTLGSALVRELKSQGFSNLIVKSHSELDLICQKSVEEFFAKEKPEYVFLAAVRLAHLGRQEPASVLYENLAMQNNIFHSAYLNGAKKVIFFGSNWMYPKEVIQPIQEKSLLQSDLDYTATAYAISKIAAFKTCEAYNMQYGTNFICLVAPNIYGETQEFDFKVAKVLPAILRKVHLAKLLEENKWNEVLKDMGLSNIVEAQEVLEELGISAKSVEIWGGGKTRREFIHSKDLAQASIFVMQNVDFKDLHKDEKFIKNTHINVGTGVDYTIKEVALMIKEIVGFKGELQFNAQKPDSTMDRLMDISKIKSLGWNPKIQLKEGIQMMYQWYQECGGGGF